MGGFSALYAVGGDLTAQYFKERFGAAIAYYPACGIPAATVTAPTLILVGDADDYSSAERCLVSFACAPGLPRGDVRFKTAAGFE